MAAFGAAAVSTSVAACGARSGLVELGIPQPIDAGVDADPGCCSADYGGPPPPPMDASLDMGSFIGAYGGPTFEDASVGDAGVDSGLCTDPGCASADYGGPPSP